MAGTSMYLHYFSVRRKGTRPGGVRVNFAWLDADKTGKEAAAAMRARLNANGDFDLRSLSYNVMYLPGSMANRGPLPILGAYGIESYDDVTA